MSNTFTQLYIQVVFAVKGRENLIRKSFKNDLLNYMVAVINARNCKVYAINSMADHVHILISFNPNDNLSDVMRDVKRSTSILIKEKKWRNKFSWQKGFGAFSYSSSHLENVKKYINDQEKHHKKTTFKEEYLMFLEKYTIDYKPEFLFEFYDDVEED